MSDVQLDNDFALPAITPTIPSLKAYFTRTPRPTTQQTLFNPDRLTRGEAYGNTLSPAAVLIPIIECHQSLHVLFTVRSQQLNKHAGQISFPGGRKETSDIDAAAAALRESFEEINLSANQVTLLGTLNDYVTSTGFQVTPVVGLVDSAFVPQCHLDEVSATLVVPLHFLMNPANYELQTRKEQNQQRSFYSLTYQGHFIWGATAAMLFGLYEALLSTESPTL